MSEYEIPTVTIETGNGPVRINAADYNPAIHRLFGVPPEATIEPQLPFTAPAITEFPQGTMLLPETTIVFTGGTNDVLTPPVADEPVIIAAGTNDSDTWTNAPAPVSYAVGKIGSKFFITDSDGNKITGVEGIDVKGYKTDSDAWAAVAALAG